MKKTIIILCTLLCFSTTAFSNNFVYDQNNKLVNYSAPYKGVEEFNLPVASKNIAADIACNFIKTYCPEVLDEINTDNYIVTHTKQYPYGYNVTFPRVINNIEYKENYLLFFIDSYTGDVVSFEKNFSNTTVEGVAQLIDTDTAKEKYKSSLGLKLQYNKRIIDNKIETYLTYTAEDVIINANTGNVIPTGYYIPFDGYFDITYTAEKVSEYVDDGAAISADKADDIVRNIKELEISEKYSIESVNYLKNYDETYLISIIYKNISDTKEVTLNAKTGLLVEYKDNSLNIKPKENNEDDPEKFANKYYSSFIANSIKRKSGDNQNTAVLYERIVNNIPYKSNGLYICYSGGKLKYVSLGWDNINFASTDEIIPLERAYEELFNRCGLILEYYKRDNSSLVPVYKLSQNGTGIIDAKTSRQLNYDGSIFYPQREMNYMDINSHYSGDIARKLSDCDIYVSSGHVFLSDNITQQEFLLLISEFIDGTKPILNTTGMLTADQSEMLYAYMFSNDIIERENADPKSYVTRAEAVKYFLKILGYGTIGNMSDIFKRHFKDSDIIQDEYIGFVELARSMGIINGNGNGYFNPDRFITNGDSLIIIYNYLKKQG